MLELSSGKISKSSFKNEDNAAFYNSLTPEVLSKFAKTCGLDTGIDIRNISDVIAQSHNVLEVGAGYGRAIEQVKRINPKAKIVAVEKSRRMYAYLKLNQDKDTLIVNQDLLEFNHANRFDTILWLWSGVADFCMTEQVQCLTRLGKHLSARGKLIIDILLPDHKKPTSAVFKGQYFTSSYLSKSTEGYLPSENELMKLASIANLSPIEVRYYEAAFEIKRAQLFFMAN